MQSNISGAVTGGWAPGAGRGVNSFRYIQAVAFSQDHFVFSAVLKLTWLALGEDQAACSRRVEQLTAL